jgi:iron complex transport system substrate-binding protein
VQDAAEQLVLRLQSDLDGIQQSAARFARPPRVFFEEWPDPLISGIQWVQELVEIGGGRDVFPELRRCKGAKDRILHPSVVIARDPEIIIGSWCGKPVKKDLIRKRDGWQDIAACRTSRIYEVKSAFILQPGPAALTEGVRQLHAIIAHSLNQTVEPALRPQEKTDPLLRSEASSPGAHSTIEHPSD